MLVNVIENYFLVFIDQTNLSCRLKHKGLQVDLREKHRRSSNPSGLFQVLVKLSIWLENASVWRCCYYIKEENTRNSFEKKG